MIAGAQRACVDAWYRGAWWLWLLRPLECVFRTAAAMRRLAYRTGLLAVYRAPVPVVVVGNITVGGTGKTPVVIALCDALTAQGYRVGVVSRGYGADNRKFPHRVEPLSTPADCGDEALLVQRRTGCTCIVDPDRAAAIRALLAHDPQIEVILSDDGLQHYGIARDFEIAVVDSKRRVGNGFCLPAGPLREPVSRLESVNQVLLRCNEPLEGKGLSNAGLTTGEQHTAITHYLIADCWSLTDGVVYALSPDVVGRHVYAVAGIGQPEQFFIQLQDLGFEVEKRPFSDHHSFTAADFQTMGDLPILMTEKDAVKCAGLAGDQAYAVRLQAQVPDALIARLVRLLKH
ncbi:MAG: tetraacyldisaccharide 4'-kinase [Halioglobus sp.]